jgi:DNA-binding NarL/FixJ family response regulator
MGIQQLAGRVPNDVANAVAATEPETGERRHCERVLVADDHPVVRAGITTAIRRHPHLTLVGEAEDGDRALELIRELAPDVALLDATLPGLDGLQVLSSIEADGLPTRVLLLSDSCNGAEVHEAISAGAASYLTKGEPVAVICDSIRRVADGERCLSAQAQAALLEHLTELDRPLLTAREFEILALMAQGSSSATIGRQLYVSESTVKNHRRHIYAKLGVTNGPAAVHQAMRVGLIR